ncbi:hypothetical protein [Streptomyces antarcticus]|uniref:hypothetical protein n=1 Tax=Streptomyces antarcticus TaxID=2996458 RepID=UPI00226E1053|nr:MULTISPECIES: hypothetical protein [unclassified Streptomyces]MCY0945997.1 hypothetical protein [Streptomyces sp. H34-AA3]MCY0953743.1 hypothetical protein [Streptomyces sp. H27-S2]MCZ4084803.1 hypothetical protein [Streptomyces sp. H34-S5]
MTEPQNENPPAGAPEPAAPLPTSPAAEAPAAQPEAPLPAAPPSEAAPAGPVTPRLRKTAVLVAAGLAVAVLAGGGVWAVSAVADADRTAPTAYWVPIGEKVQKAEEPAPVPANALSGKLLPVPSGFTPGPDLAGDGNNFFVSGEKAVEGFKEARDGLSSTERKKRDDMLAGLKLKGLAGRSYTKGSGYLVAEVRLMQADPQAVGGFSEVTKKLMELSGADRGAPKVDGHPDAKCWVLPVGEEKKEKIDSLYCVAVEGDVMVNFRAFGPKPEFSATEAVGFLKNQLNHLKSPGESA